MIPARMRNGDSWSDTSILNISSRGLLLYAATAPLRGSYVEIRRGQHVIVARVVWSNANRFGVRAQDSLAIDAIVANGSANGAPANDTNRSVERRSRPRQERLEWRHTQSREKGRLLEFAFLVGAGLIFAMFAHETIGLALSQPLESITVRLAGKA